MESLRTTLRAALSTWPDELAGVVTQFAWGPVEQMHAERQRFLQSQQDMREAARHAIQAVLQEMRVSEQILDEHTLKSFLVDLVTRLDIFLEIREWTDQWQVRTHVKHHEEPLLATELYHVGARRLEDGTITFVFIHKATNNDWLARKLGAQWMGPRPARPRRHS